MNHSCSTFITFIVVSLAWGSFGLSGEIHDAAKTGDLEKVKALVKANPDIVFSKGSWAPLTYAAEAALLGAIAYFILPFDFIPDMLPVLGFTDDAAVLATAIRMVATHIKPEHRDAARAALKRGVEAAD